MNAQHTPGPWRFLPGNETAPGYVVGREACAFVAQLLGKDGRRNPETQERADANLIAAAPELLDGLRQMTDAYAKAMRDAGVTRYPEALAVVRAARAALAKAKGEP